MNERKLYLSSEKSKSVHKNGLNPSLMRLKMLNIKKNLWTIPKPQFFFFRYKKKACGLNRSYSLLNRNLNSKHHLYPWELWEHSFQENIFCGIYRISSSAPSAY